MSFMGFIRKKNERDTSFFISARFAKFNSSTIASALAAETFRLSVAWWMLKNTDSLLLFASALTASSFCQVSARLAVGWLGDRFSPLAVMRISLAIQAAVMACLGLMLLSGLIAPVLIIVLFAVLGACLGSREPLANALIPSLVGSSNVTRAMGQRGSLSSALSLLGPVLGGAALATAGAPASIVLAGGLTLVCLLLLLTVDVPVQAKTLQQLSGGTRGFLRDWGKETWAGLRVFVQLKADFWLCMISCAINLVLPAFFSVVIPYLVVKVHQLPQQFIGVFDVCFAAGMLLGGLKLVHLSNAAFGKRASISIGLACLSLPQFMFAISSNVYINAAAMFLGGCGMLNLFTNISSLRAVATPIEFRSRIFGSASFLVAISMPPGIWTVSRVLDSWGHTTLLYGSGALILVSAGCVYLVPDLSRLMSLSEKECENAYRRFYPKAFR